MIKLRKVAVLMGVLSLSIWGCFKVNYKAQNITKDVRELEKMLADELSQIHVLKAEWNYLNHPGRLLKLTNKFLDIENIEANRIIHFKNIQEANLSSFEARPIVNVNYKKSRVKWRYKP